MHNPLSKRLAARSIAKRSATASLLLLAVTLHAQDYSTELVRNGGFEDLAKSVRTYDQFSNVTGWSEATLGLAEVFDRGASAKTIGIPDNDYGSMEPFEGDHYAGFCGWKADIQRTWSADAVDPFVPGWHSYSEYLKGELVFPLVEDATYELVMHVALAQNSDRSIMGVGAHFSPLDLHYQHRKFMEEDPEVFSAKIIEEKGKWVEIRDTFVADGKEKFIYVGVFPYVGLESKDLVEGPDNLYAYYYVDGISLKRVEPTP